MGFLNMLFGKKPSMKSIAKQAVKKAAARPTPKKPEAAATKRIHFPFAIYEPGEKIDSNRWYQKESWKNKSFVSYKGTWDSNWKWSEEGKVKVAGISRDNRTEDFLNMAHLDSFKMFLENDPDNPVNKNARKIMASAEIDGEMVTKQIGYLPDKIANKYSGTELNIRPAKAFLLSNTNVNLGVEVALLVRSARYLNKQ